MSHKSLIFISFVFCFYFVRAQESTNSHYQQTYSKIDNMLVKKTPLNFKEAVLATENAYFDGVLNYKQINYEIENLTKLTSKVTETKIIDYVDLDQNIIVKQAALFKMLTDSIPIILDSTHVFMHLPFTYDFDDMWGEKDWSKMFVSKLLATGSGNCHSLPYLYKILAEEMGIPAYLAFAPNHIYIKSYSEKTGWYNTELTSGTFPIDAWIIASGYVTVEAIQNGLYMDTLSTKQSVANCLVDLAQGYQHKFGKDNPEFVIKCCNTCLKYHPTNVNAMLTKAEAQKYYIQTQMKAKKVKTPQELFADNSVKEMYTEMEQTYVKLHQLGYRRMPEEMYMKWMGILKNEPNKYNNTKMSVSKKKK